MYKPKVAVYDAVNLKELEEKINAHLDQLYLNPTFYLISLKHFVNVTESGYYYTALMVYEA